MKTGLWDYAKTVFQWLTAITTVITLGSFGIRLYDAARASALEETRLPDIPWSAVVGLAIFTALMFFGVLFFGRLGSRALSGQASSLAGEILEFRAQRSSADPSMRLGQNRPGDDEETKNRRWHEQTNKMIAYSQETMAEYTQRFASLVIWFHGEFAKRGITDDEFNRFYEHPTNPIGIGIVGTHLGAMAQRLRVK